VSGLAQGMPHKEEGERETKFQQQIVRIIHCVIYAFGQKFILFI